MDGSSGNDTLIGGEGRDQLLGGSGDDVLRGSDGDFLQGGGGRDSYLFGRGDGVVTISDASWHNAEDTLHFLDASHNNLWFSRDNNNLVVDLLGSDDQIVIQNWYSGSRSQVENIRTTDAALHANAVDSLVNAMAAFDAPSAAEASLDPQIREAIQPVIASSWHRT